MPGVYQGGLDRYEAAQFTETDGGISKRTTTTAIVRAGWGGKMIRKYCKAYYLKDLRQFGEWTEKREESEEALTDEDVVYLWDDFVVVKSPVLPGGVIFDQVTPEWQEFCKTTLGFEIPEDLRYAYENPEEKESTKEEPETTQSEATL
jgi:hypothetical protein